MYGQPVDLNGNLYVRSSAKIDLLQETVLEYTPDSDQWTELSIPPVNYITVATLGGQLLVVGGMDKSTAKITNSILTYDEDHKQWVQSYPVMPTAVMYPAAIAYQNYLIVAGGWNGSNQTLNVNILNTSSNQWITAEPLPSADFTYYTVLIQDTIFLVGQLETQTVLRAHVPTLLSGAKSGVWETLKNTPYLYSSPVVIGNMLLTLGGTDDKATTSIEVYDPTKNNWTKVGDLPEPMTNCNCIVSLGKLFVLGGYGIASGHVYVASV